MAELHEPRESLSQESLDLHRAINSLIEELDAVDWYQQRVDATSDPDLKAILAHNRDEEIEHAMMVLEYIRRRNPTFDEKMRTYLFTEGDITHLEEEATGKENSQEAPAAPAPPRVTVGSLRRPIK